MSPARVKSEHQDQACGNQSQTARHNRALPELCLPLQEATLSCSPLQDTVALKTDSKDKVTPLIFKSLYEWIADLTFGDEYFP